MATSVSRQNSKTKQDMSKDSTTLYVLGKPMQNIALATRRRILITRTDNNAELQQATSSQNSIMATNSKRILVTRVENPVPHSSYPKNNSPTTKTVMGTLSPGSKNDIFVVRAKSKEVFENSNISRPTSSKTKTTGKKKSKK